MLVQHLSDQPLLVITHNCEFQLLDEVIKLSIRHQTNFFRLVTGNNFNSSDSRRRYYDRMRRRSAIAFECIHTDHLFIGKLNNDCHGLRSQNRRPVITMKFPFFHITVETSVIRFSQNTFNISLSHPLLYTHNLLVRNIAGKTAADSQSQCQQ